jgi:hypothetical protein
MASSLDGLNPSMTFASSGVRPWFLRFMSNARKANEPLAGSTREVAFESVDGPINERIDEAYRAKYHGNPYLGSMVSARARVAISATSAGDVRCSPCCDIAATQTNAVLVYLDSRAARRDMPTLRKFKGSDCASGGRAI